MNIYVDFEANGVSQEQEIISIGAITESGETFYSLVRPHALLDKKIKELTHISQSEASKAPCIEDVMESFRCWIDSVSDSKVMFLVFGSSDRQFVSKTIEKTEDKATKEILTFLHNRINNVEKRVAQKFHRETIGLQSAYLTMRGMTCEELEGGHNALFDATMLKYVWENIDAYELPEGVEVVKVPKADMYYGKKKSQKHQLTGSKKTKAAQAIRRCPAIASKKFNIKVKCSKGNRAPIVFDNLRGALSLMPHRFNTAEDKLNALEKLYDCVKNGEPICEWTIEEVK